MKNTPAWIWHNGQFVPWADANVHVMAHGLHYGSSVFEGIRCYETESGPAAFRLDDHLQRLFESCKMYRMESPFDYATIRQACCDVISRNDLTDAYIRPIIFRDADGLGLAPTSDHPIGCSVMAFEWGPLHGAEAMEKGNNVGISSWRRLSSATNPVMSKAVGHYLTSQLIAMEARQNGYDAGLAVNDTGSLVEGAGANVFLFHKGQLLTPGLGLSILDGITRNTVLAIAKRLEVPIVETQIPRELIYRAEEVFLAGTAAEVSPIRSVDGIEIGNGKPGPVTRKFQSQYKDIVTGRAQYDPSWLAFVDSKSNRGNDVPSTTGESVNA